MFSERSKNEPLVNTLKWKLWLALTRQDLTAEQLSQRETQRQWISDYITTLPEKPPTYVRSKAIGKIEQLFADPLCPVFQEPLSDAQFQTFVQSLEDDEDPFPRIRRDLIAMLNNQLAALPPEAADPALESWRQELAAEIAALDEDPQRGIWPDGLPAAIQVSLEPYRERLEASYSPILNVLELSRNRRQGWSIKGE